MESTLFLLIISNLKDTDMSIELRPINEEEIAQGYDSVPFWDGSKPLVGRSGDWEVLVTPCNITISYKANTPQEVYYIWEAEGGEPVKFITPELGRLVLQAIFSKGLTPELGRLVAEGTFANGEPDPDWLLKLGFFRA